MILVEATSFQLVKLINFISPLVHEFPLLLIVLHVGPEVVRVTMSRGLDLFWTFEDDEGWMVAILQTHEVLGVLTI